LGHMRGKTPHSTYESGKLVHKLIGLSRNISNITSDDT
jgi:hypothetical protein